MAPPVHGDTNFKHICSHTDGDTTCPEPFGLGAVSPVSGAGGLSSVCEDNSFTH